MKTLKILIDIIMIVGAVCIGCIMALMIANILI